MEAKNKIIEKIKKLLILADRNKNSNIEEAAAAAEKAQALMEKHRIEQAMLNIQDTLGLEQLQDEGLPNNWKVFLAFVLSKHNGCYIIKSQDYDQDNKVMVVGESQDIQSIQTIYKYLVLEMNKLCIKAILKYQVLTKKLPNKDFAESFYTGAIQTVDYRLSEINKSVRNDHICSAGSSEQVVQVCSAIERLDSRISIAKSWIENQGSDAGLRDVHFQSETAKNESKEGFDAGIKAAGDLDLSTNKKLPGKEKT